jgi:hypothetical protein
MTPDSQNGPQTASSDEMGNGTCHNPPHGTTFASVPGLQGLHDHTTTLPHSVELLWTSDQPVAETST